MVTKVRQGYFFHSIIIGGNAPYGVSGQPYTTTPAIIAVPPGGLLLLISSNRLTTVYTRLLLILYVRHIAYHCTLSGLSCFGSLLQFYNTPRFGTCHCVLFVR